MSANNTPTNLARWKDFENHKDYECNCHMGACFVHGDGVDNPAREEFLVDLTKALGITPHAENSDDYGSEKRSLARGILHAADFYVRQVMKQVEESKAGSWNG